MRALFLVAAIATAVGSGATEALSQPEPLDSPYVSEDGEELFGPDYLPQSPVDRGLELYMARPNAGIQVPDALMLLPQDAFGAPMAADLSLPVDPFTRQLPREIPLLRDVRRRLQVSSAADPLAPQPSSDEPQVAAMTGVVRLHYVFVGQGAGAIVELPCGIAVVDIGGEQGSGETDVLDGGALFVEYLEAFFEERPELDRTIDVIYLSHPHADHINGRQEIVVAEPPFTIGAIVDNGQSHGLGSAAKQEAFRNWAIERGAKYAAIERASQFTATGAANAAIDPFECATVSAFWGSANDLVLTTPGYDNPNNHSVVLRIDFGEASFLFLGDLQDVGAADMLAEYEENPDVFDADVLHVSHHGADGDTTDELLAAITPQIAVISMGTAESEGQKTAFDYGHPRLTTLAILQDDPEIVSDPRSPVETFWGAEGAETGFHPVDISQSIYGTGWEGTVIVTATPDGDLTIETLGVP